MWGGRGRVDWRGSVDSVTGIERRRQDEATLEIDLDYKRLSKNGVIATLTLNLYADALSIPASSVENTVSFVFSDMTDKVAEVKVDVEMISRVRTPKE